MQQQWLLQIRDSYINEMVIMGGMTNIEWMYNGMSCKMDGHANPKGN